MRPTAIPVLLLIVFALGACSGNKPKPNEVFLMPAPDVYEEGSIDPFIDNDPISRGVQPGILYATDRAPAEPGDRKYDYYTHERGHALTLGVAKTRLGHDDAMTWEEARRISLLKNRTTDYPIDVVDVEEFGALAETIRPFYELERSEEPIIRFRDEINRNLALSRSKDVYIYVHGYKVNFENPVLVASELWHFLGYNGAFIAYSWPTRFSMWAYLADLDSALNSARNLRALVIDIALNTDAERIHIIGYSMGTRLVSRMLADLGIYGMSMEQDDIKTGLKLGNVILIGSDVDRGVLGGYILDGAIRVPSALTIYQSSVDNALGMSKRVFGRERAGQVVDVDELSPATRKYFEDNPNLRLIDVSDAESASGHGYFRKSPWVSSDILMTLLYDLAPQDRGLVRNPDLPVWEFPPDYIERLRQSLGEANPALATEATN